MNNFFKRLFDFIFAFLGILVLIWPLFFIIIFASIDTKSFGLFFQKRVGQFGKTFSIVKIKTMSVDNNNISLFGAFLRNSKLDELPQLVNILLGQMSFVGPRPDVPGYYDKLEGEKRKVLELKPGLTSEASIKYANEEELLKNHSAPDQHNDEVIFPDKVKMNLLYYYNQNFLLDLKIIIKTIFKI